ncbi:HesA/MoeB/ThiF family protein [Puniceicoccus vermicola]|uniref:Molybdopterin-synthase adenylyltransferase n=1 Tax=Puniceicoccus vermicola TaxID=388746 RepID=A0A7X1B0S1_9BACT|nr:HesA/MoeB/ThiF family protein [Puniceicoccus vermicola]MBC2603506.1 molybdopterin-synthase adenylyltransferase MoeB [Puniceicoccus vermicola]
MTVLSPKETLRYQRHLSLPGFGREAQLRLKKSRVLMVGAGGLGCPALQYLVAAGVGTIGIVDDDKVTRSNLQRQVLFTDEDLGRLKAEVAADRLRAMNGDITCHAYPVRLDAESAIDFIEEYDLVVDGTDNFSTRYVINDACVLTGKPWIFGALHSFQGQVSVLNCEGGPTYRCLFPEPPEAGDALNCAENGVLGVLPGIIGAFQATEAIKVLTGIGTPLIGKLLIFDALEMTQQMIRFERDPEQIDRVHMQEEEAISTTRTEEIERIAMGQAEIESGIRSGAFQVIDVRDLGERVLGEIKGAVSLPLIQIEEGGLNWKEIGLDPSVPTCVFCSGGLRSVRGSNLLRNQFGFRDVKVLEWNE